MRALLYVELWTLINTLRSTLRSPRRLIPALLMLGWLFIVVLHSFLFSPSSDAVDPSRYFARVVPQGTIWSALFLMLVLMSVQIIFRAFSEGLLVFQISQVDFLFPTPISRRRVLLVKLLKDYVMTGVVIGFALVIIVAPFGGGRAASFTLVGWAAATLLMAFVMNVSHTLNIVLTFRAEQLNWVSRAMKIGFYAFLAAGVLGFLVYSRSRSPLMAFNSIVHSTAARVFFLPFSWTTDLMLSRLSPTPEPMTKLWALAGLAAASFLVLMTRPENIYEPSIGISVKVSKARAAMRRGDMSAAVAERMRDKSEGKQFGSPIPPFGLGAVAIVWKNLVTVTRKARAALITSVMALLVFLIVGRSYIGQSGSYTPIWITVVLYVLWFGAQMSQRETRAELRQANMLKAMPIAGWKVMLAQVTYHSVLLIASIITLMGVFALVVPSAVGKTMILAAVAIPSLVFATVAGASLATPLYPDLKDPIQNLLSTLIATFLGTIAIVGSILAAFVLLQLRAPVYAAAGVITLFNTAITVVAIALAGACYNRFDPTSE